MYIISLGLKYYFTAIDKRIEEGKKSPVSHLANIIMGDYVRNSYENSLNHFSGSFMHLHLVQNQN